MHTFRLAASAAPHSVREGCFMLSALFDFFKDRPPRQLVADPFLRPYVATLLELTSTDSQERIVELDRSELITLHFAFGMGVRNRFMNGGCEPELVRFFEENGVNHRDCMGSILIEALWQDLNQRLSPERRTAIQRERTIRAQKRKVYEALEKEGRAQLVATRADFDLIMDHFGPMSLNVSKERPLFQLVVDKTGRLRQVRCFQGANPKFRAGIEAMVSGFKFSPIADGDSLTLRVLHFPQCSVTARDRLPMC
jgi:hypothetical protein